MATEHNRLLMQLDKYRRDVNREIINPRVPELALEDLKPVLRMVARVRADYVAELLALADSVGDRTPDAQQIARLKALRETYDELVAATNALETVIQRDYLDVKH